MMAVFDTCGCCSLRTGAIVVGVIQLILSLFLTSLGVYLLSVPDLGLFLENAWKKLYFFNGPVIVAQNGTAGPLPLNLGTGRVLTIEFSLLIWCIILAAACLSNVLLVFGAAKRLAFFMVQWLVLQWISLIAVIAVLGVALWQLLLADSVGRYWWILVFGTGILILLLIALLFVLSLYQTVRDEELPELRENIELLNRHLWIPKQHRYFD